MEEKLPSEIVFPAQTSPRRLDLFLQETYPAHSRTFWQKKIKEGQVLIAGKTGKPSQLLVGGEVIALPLASLGKSAIKEEAIPLKIIYEDEHLIVIDKPAGLVTHPAPGHPDHTLVNALMHHCPNIFNIGGENRPGLVHRLDKDTSGLMVIAKNEATYQSLKNQWEKRLIKREYLALCTGHWRDKEIIVEAPIGRDMKERKKMAVTALHSRAASTSFSLREDLGKFAYVKAVLQTGRTHQIRVHLAFLKHPLIGDQLYGSENTKKLFGRQALHAHRLGFTHPLTKEFCDFYSDLPLDMSNLLNKLRSLV